MALIKFVFKGANQAGKTQFLKRFVKQDAFFDENYTPTTAGEFLTKSVHSTKLDTPIQFQIWDIAGGNQNNQLGQIFERGAVAIVYCIDLSQPIVNSAIVEEIRGIKSRNPQCPIILLGTKADLCPDTAEQSLSGINASVDMRIVTSARDRTGFEDVEAALLQYAEKHVDTSLERDELPPVKPGKFFNSTYPSEHSETKVYTGSSFTSDQIAAIQKLITSLQKEVDSCWPYPNKDLKNIKINGLNHLLNVSQSMDAQAAVRDTLARFPDMQNGKYSTRTADLLSQLQEAPKQAFTK